MLLFNVEKEKLVRDISQVFKDKNTRVHSLVTLHVPPMISLSEFSKLFASFRKKQKLYIYFYSFEIGEKKGHLHLHLITSACFSNKIALLKRSWYSTLQKKITNLSLLSLDQCLHYEVILEDTWCNCIHYLLKCNEKEHLIDVLGIKKFGGSLDIKQVISGFKAIKSLSISATYCALEASEDRLTCEISALSSSVFKDINGFSLTFDELLERVMTSYNHPEISIDLIKRQVIYEVVSYSENLVYFNFDNFISFLGMHDTLISKYYMDLHFLFKHLCTMNDYAVIRNYIKQGNALYNYIGTSSIPYKNLVFSFLHNHIPFLNINGLSSVIEDLNSSNAGAAIFLITNMLYKMFRAHNSSLLQLMLSIGKFVRASFTDDDLRKFGVLGECSSNVLCHLGHMVYHLIKVSFADHSILQISEVHSGVDTSKDFEDDDSDYWSNFMTLETDGLSVFQSKRIQFEYNLHSLSELLPKFNQHSLQNVQLHTKILRPFIVPPKRWAFGDTELVRDGVCYTNAVFNFTGGPLINDILIRKSLCKNLPFVKHSLLLNNDIFDVLNKAQEIPLCIDCDLLNFYKEKFNFLPGILSPGALKNKRLEYANLRKRLSKLYIDRKNLLQIEGSTNMRSVIDAILKTRLEKESLESEITKHNLTRRLLKSFAGVTESPIYFAYEYDFRMRMYAVPHELSHVAHKFSRSLIRFQNTCDFDVESFKKYSVAQFIEVRDLNELEVLAVFETDIRFLLENYSSETSLSIISSRAKEPFIFLACCAEWSRYTKAFSTSSPYVSQFPIYFDCTAQGPQIMSVFFALRTFSKYLNLCEQDRSDKKGDYYSAVLLQFLEKLKKDKWPYLLQKENSFTSDLINWLRKHLKQSIMTLIYGVSMRKFMDAVDSMCNESDAKDMLGSAFNIGDIYAFKTQFTKSFWTYTHSLPIFQLKPLLKSYYDNLGPHGVLEWSVLGSNIIRPLYPETRSRRLKSQVFRDKHHFVIYEVLDKVLKRKQMSSLLANFTHSLDGWLLNRIYSRVGFDLLSIHDSFGIHGVNEALLRQTLRELLEYLLEHGFDFFTSQWAKTLEESAGIAAKERFLKVVSEISRGDLSKSDLRGAHHFIS